MHVERDSPKQRNTSKNPRGQTKTHALRSAPLFRAVFEAAEEAGSLLCFVISSRQSNRLKVSIQEMKIYGQHDREGLKNFTICFTFPNLLKITAFNRISSISFAFSQL
jgi:hypothetical protein